MLPIVGQMLSNGHKLSIDDSTVSRYPIPERTDIYKQCGAYVKTLEVSCVTELQLKNILALFPNVSQLTLKNVSIVENRLESYPQSLRKLRLVNCKALYLINWLKDIRSSLEMLHLEHVSQSDVLTFKRTDTFEKLTSFTLIGNNVLNRSQFPICPAIEILHLDIPNGVNNFCWLPGSPLKSLTLNQSWANEESPAYKMMQGYSRLQILVFLNEVEPKRRTEIEALQLDSVDVQYSEESNLITMLNEDCLEYLLKFMSIEDWLVLQRTHPVFNRLIRSQRIVTYTIDDSSLERRPLASNRKFYERIGSTVKSLIIGKISSDDCLNAFKHFSKATSLEFTIFNKKSFQILKLFKNIRKFKARSLEKCDRNLKDFFDRNVESMEHINVDYFGTLTLTHKKSYTCISKMKNLKTLHAYFEKQTAQYFPEGCLPLLEHLSFDDLSRKVDCFLDKLDGQNIRTITNLPLDSQYNFDRFPLLEYISRRKNWD